MCVVCLELHVLRDILMHKYGRDLSAAVMENRDGMVTERVSVHPRFLPRLCRVRLLVMLADDGCYLHRSLLPH